MPLPEMTTTTPRGAGSRSFTSTTQRQQPAIEAWKSVVDGVKIDAADVPGDGRFLVGHLVTDNGNGTWRYEYAIQNLNSHRSGNSFRVPVPAGVTITNAGFKDIDYHSGDPFDPTDWSISTSGGAVTWTGGDFATNLNGNALRFATLYNFWFDADRPPTDVGATIGLFRPGTGTTVAASVFGPSAPPSTPGDFNGDGLVDGLDLGVMLSQWGTDGSADLNGDGLVDGSDLGMLLANWT
jgi:hypothetical protein